MFQFSSNAVFFMTLLGFLTPNSIAAEYLALKELCESEATLPKPPCCGLNNQFRSRIFFGNLTELNEFPWLVHMCNLKWGECGTATIINSRWVLTAAHNIKSRNLEVSLGEWNLKTDPDCVGNICKKKVKKIKVDKVIKPNRNDAVYGLHNIALLHLAEVVTFDEYIRPICLPLNGTKEQEFTNKIAIAAGWGLTENGKPSDVLLKASLKVLDTKRCKAFDKMICATGVGKITTGYGDSGGPLMLKVQNYVEKLEPYFQIGVLSGKQSSGSKKAQSVYTYVPSYMEWIKKTLLKN